MCSSVAQCDALEPRAWRATGWADSQPVFWAVIVYTTCKWLIPIHVLCLCLVCTLRLILLLRTLAYMVIVCYSYGYTHTYAFQWVYMYTCMVICTRYLTDPCSRSSCRFAWFAFYSICNIVQQFWREHRVQVLMSRCSFANWRNWPSVFTFIWSFDHLIAYSEIHRESIQFRQDPFGSIWEILGIQWIERISKRFMGLQLNEEVILGRAA